MLAATAYDEPIWPHGAEIPHRCTDTLRVKRVP